MIDVPKSLRRLTLEVEGWLELDCPQKALAKLEPLLATPGARPAGLYLETRALVALGRYGDALDRLSELRTFHSDADWLDLTEAWCRKRTGDVRGAADCMQRLLGRSRRSAIGHYNLGCYLALLGDKDRAIDEVTLACGLERELRRAAASEQDLESLHGDPRFDDLIEGHR